MTYFSIDTKSKQAKKMVELLETLPFVKILDDPNATTKQAMDEARKGKVAKHKSAKDMIDSLNK